MLNGLDEAKEILDIADKKEIIDVAGKDHALLQQAGFNSPWFNRYSYALSPPTRFFEKYGAEIKQSQQIDAFYNANLIDIRLSDDLGHVKSLRVQNYNGQISDVSATQYVLAARWYRERTHPPQCQPPDSGRNWQSQRDGRSLLHGEPESYRSVDF